jgi:hypothetical protein
MWSRARTLKYWVVVLGEIDTDSAMAMSFAKVVLDAKVVVFLARDAMSASMRTGSRSTPSILETSEWTRPSR